MKKKPKPGRVIGTTEESLARAESQLSRELPQSFRSWLIANNGLRLDSVEVFPVLDDRDPRKTWDSIVRQYSTWKSYHSEPLETKLGALLPFATSGSGEYYCFDYSQIGATGEPVVVLAPHDTDELELRAESFMEFTARLAAGEFEDD